MRRIRRGIVTGNNKDSYRIHIILDASRVNRCAWCGSPVSDHWISGEGGSYCSEECLKEWWRDRNSATICIPACMTIVMPPLLLAIWFTDSPFMDDTQKLLIVGFGSVMLAILSIITISFYKDQIHRTDRPKGSRRNIGVSEASLLRNISTSIECPNCDATIDLNSVGEDMIYHRHYCGANGVIEIKMAE